ncbi:hypothetical protein GCM10011511_51670 [Puia dinghuensis]|uniref:Uncharacterized protein n=1 Tax=Puia dinghuensis TaxID=1792502 RepID=A0A8J2XWP9_9BACT|nr:hypothetical protein GCM10011511_51670 [Puia dinghuensis]
MLSQVTAPEFTDIAEADPANVAEAGPGRGFLALGNTTRMKAARQMENKYVNFKLSVLLCKLLFAQI